jgi:hypothetical protein
MPVSPSGWTAAGSLLLFASLAAPAASAQVGDPNGAVTHLTTIAEVTTGYALQTAASVAGFVPTCKPSDPDWAVACEGNGDYAACRTDPDAFATCRILLGGKGGDSDLSAIYDFSAAVTGVADDAVAQAEGSSGRLRDSGNNLATQAAVEAITLSGWAGNEAVELGGKVLEAAEPFQNNSLGLADGAWGKVEDFLLFQADRALEAAHAGFGFIAPNERFTAHADSGPATVSATNRRPGDPCSGQPQHGLRVLGSDCDGHVYLDASMHASVDCNAYTSILLRQPCGGFLSDDWSFTAQGLPVYAGPFQRARLTIGSDGVAQVHDVLGVLHCKAGVDKDNGYVLQSAYVNVTESTFKHQETGEEIHWGSEATRNVILFQDMGTCTINSLWGWSGELVGYFVAYDATHDGQPYSWAGTFTEEDPAVDLVDCNPDADFRPGTLPLTPDCTIVTHTGDD